jgi:hypothetical protein
MPRNIARTPIPMNEQNPETVPLNVPYKDRSTGLLIFGILTIGLGCLSGLLVLLMLAGQALAARSAPNPQLSSSAILPVILMYVVLGVALVWLGIGSIMARRWARALLLIFSWSWLGIGVLSLVNMAFILPKVLANLPSTGTTGHPAVPAAAMEGILVGMLLMQGFIFVILPGVWTYFYNSWHVKATCEARDPVTSWTDACPLPVLGLCLYLSFGVVGVLMVLFTYNSVMPFFGIFITGTAGTILYLGMAVLWGYAAWLLYHLERRGWWLILIAMSIFMASTLLTYARHDILEMYHLMGYPQAQIDQIQKMGLLTGNRMVWMTSFSMLPFLGYLFFIKKYFSDK